MTLPGIHPQDVADVIIVPSLLYLDCLSRDAERLLLGTAAVESRLTHLRQLGGGPALGLWQMEPRTHNDIWRNYIGHRALLHARLCVHLGDEDPSPEMLPWRMTWDLRYACIMARIHYLRVPHPLPTTVEGDALYWKKWYNTRLGQGTVRGYIDAWNRIIAGRVHEYKEA